MKIITNREESVSANPDVLKRGTNGVMVNKDKNTIIEIVDSPFIFLTQNNTITTNNNETKKLNKNVLLILYPKRELIPCNKKGSVRK